LRSCVTVAIDIQLLFDSGVARLRIKDDRDNFVSLTSNKDLWDEVLNNSERSAVLIAAASFEVQLERLLKAYLIQGSSASKDIAEKSNFATKINLCFSLALINDDERIDLHKLREIRNAFAHNIFGCDFSNSDVSSVIMSLILPSRIKFCRDSARTYFNIGMIMLDTSLNTRIPRVAAIQELTNHNYSNG
jgi:hypothetical protein